jgi:NAD(P)-dependent dehydrogenase (short-subunit alcohol dehydrogenase family)
LMCARTLASSLTSTSGKFVSPCSSLRTRVSHHLQNRRRRFATSAMSKYTPGDALTNVTVVVTGSNRGIGLQLAKELLENDNVVVTTARDVGKAKELLDLQSKYGEDKVRVTELDVGSEASVKEWASNLAKDKIKVDVLINNAGIIGTEPGYKKWTWDLVDQNEMMEVFRVNSVGPLIVSQQLLKHNVLNRPALIANVTSKVGSVDDNGSGKGYAYRASKAALNIINKSMSIDLKEEFDCTCMLLHPGWVQTDMTEKRGLIETPECAKGLIKALEGKYGPLNGCWYDYKGDEIPW